ncbi:MAG: ABC transporter ATP-binding protein [Myxococcota bacterium]
MSAAPDELLKNTYDPQLIRRMVRLMHPHRVLFAFSLLLYVPLNASALLQPYLLGRVVDGVLQKGPSPEAAQAVANLGFLYLAALMVQTLGQFIQLSAMQLMGQRVTRDLRLALFRKIQRLHQAYFDRTPAGRVMTRVTSDVESLAELFASGSITILGDILFLVATAALLFWTSTRLTLAAFVVLPLLAVGVHYFRRAAREAFREVRTQVGRLNGFLQEHISGMAVVQLFGQEARTARKFDEINDAYRKANQRAIALDAGIYAFVESVSTTSVAILLVMASSEILGGTETLGVAVAFVEYLQRFYLPVRDLSTKYTLVQSALAGAERVFSLIDEPEHITERQEPVKLGALKEGLSFKRVTFAYGGGNVALRDVTFHVKPGEKIALVGRTGSGKTTLTRLLLRHYETGRGMITVDGTDVQDMELRTLRRNILAVPQEVHLFSGTVADNLRFGAPSASDEQLWRALEAVQARVLVERVGGLGANIKERGINLSVGERQLLAFARALVADPPCIILDEATASVDPETERLLQVATAKLLEGRTALIVAHRLSTLTGCDRILVMQRGQLVEQGSHDELITLGGYYARLHALQEASVI